MNGGDGRMNDEAVPLLDGAPPRVRVQGLSLDHAIDMAESADESNPLMHAARSGEPRPFSLFEIYCVILAGLVELRAPDLVQRLVVGRAEAHP